MDTFSRAGGNFAALSPEFPKQVDAMLARLDAAAQNKPVAAAAAAPILDEMARRAQERLVLAQVAREIQANLRHMEHVLDAFFRDHAKRADLRTLAHDSKQISGALTILGLERAERLLMLCQQQIDDYARPFNEAAHAHVGIEHKPQRQRLAWLVHLLGVLHEFRRQDVDL